MDRQLLKRTLWKQSEVCLTTWKTVTGGSGKKLSENFLIILGDIKGPAAFGGLVVALQDPEEEVRAVALLSLRNSEREEQAE